MSWDRSSFESIDADDLDIGVSDFVASGDFLPLYTFGPPAKRNVTFTTTSYSFDAELSQQPLQWDQMFPADTQTAVLGQIRMTSIGTDESVSLRVQNSADNETVSEQTAITSTGMVSLGPVNYTPSTTSGLSRFRLEWKESNGTNSSRIDLPYIAFGVQL